MNLNNVSTPAIVYGVSRGDDLLFNNDNSLVMFPTLQNAKDYISSSDEPAGWLRVQPLRITTEADGMHVAKTELV